MTPLVIVLEPGLELILLRCESLLPCRQAEEAANGPEAVDPTGADGDGEEDPGSTSDEGDDEEEYDSALEDDAVVVDDEENSSSEVGICLLACYMKGEDFALG